MLELPLTPFRALEGVESGAGSIRDFNATARQFNDLLASLPQQTRWQLQLFLYDLESRDSLQRGVASLEQMAESSQRFSAAFEHLPEATRRELTTFLAESPQTQRDLRLTIASAADALARVDPLLHTLERVAGAVGGAGDSWAEVVREVKRERPADVAAAARPEGRPFDIADYERTARAVQGAAAEIRAALAELPSGSDWSPLVDQLFWRAVALMGVAFALLLTYRILTRRFGAEPHVVRRG